MKRFLPSVVVAVMVSLFAFGGTGLAAEKIGVVDLAIVIDESKAGKEANSLLNNFIEERRHVVAELEANLNALNETLEHSDLTAEERARVQIRFDSARQDYSDTVSFFEAEIDGAIEELRGQILAEVNLVLQMIGDAQQYDLILDSSAAVYFGGAIDLTFEVIRMYDELWDEAVAERAATQSEAGQDN